MSEAQQDAAPTYKCDGCGRQESGELWPGGWFKPGHWFSRTDADGQQFACSRGCIAVVAEKTGKTGLVLPI